MTETLHKNIPFADNHSLIKHTASSASNRRGLTVGKGEICEQTDTSPSTYWMSLTAGAGTAAWSRIDTGAEVVSAGVDWAAQFPGAYQVIQPGGYNGAVNFAANTLASGGGTPPVGSLTGALSGQTVPLWFKCTTGGAIGSGAVFAAYADGLGTTPFMTGITPTVGSPVALTGVGTGVSHAWAAGTATTSHVWKAVASAPDRSGNGKHATASGSTYPLVTAGNNGRACLASDGVDDLLVTNSLNLPAPGTTPYYVFAVFRFLSNIADQALLGNGDFAVAHVVAQDVSNAAVYQKNSSTVVATGVTPSNWNILEIKRSNSSGDTFKVGSVTATGNAGNLTVTNGRIFGSPGAGAAAAAELAVLVITPVAPTWSAIRALVASEYSGVAA